MDEAAGEQARYSACSGLTPLSLSTRTADPPFTAPRPSRTACAGPPPCSSPHRDREEGRECAGGGPLGAEAPDLLSSSAVRTVYEDAPAVLRRLVEEVLLRTQRHLERHDQLLAQGVDGRIRDLREVLLEVREQELRPLGEDGQRRVGAHRAVRSSLPPLAIGERSSLRSSIVTRKRAAARRGSMARDARPASRRPRSGGSPQLQPPPVRLPPEQRPLDVLVVQKLVPLGVHDQHPARPQPPPLDDVLGRDAMLRPPRP